MPIEFPKEPWVEVQDNTAHHILAFERTTENGKELSLIAGEVAVGATTHKRFREDRATPATIIEGRIGDKNIYEKIVGNTGPFTSLVYGLRIGIARRKAARHVRTALKA